MAERQPEIDLYCLHADAAAAQLGASRAEQTAAAAAVERLGVKVFEVALRQGEIAGCTGIDSRGRIGRLVVIEMREVLEVILQGIELERGGATPP